MVFLLDADDPTIEDYPTNCLIGAPMGHPTGPLNVAVAQSQSPIVGFMGDDSRFETAGWDCLVTEALAAPGFCWGDDGHDRPWPSTAFISREITDALGYMVPPTLQRGFFDVVWTVLAKLTDTECVIPAMFRHDNSAGDPKSPNFKPEAQVPPAVIVSDERAFNQWLNEDSKRDAQRIRRAIYR